MESVEPTQMSSQVTTTKDTVQHTGRPKKHPNAKAVLRLFAMFVILVCAGLVASIVQGISHLLLRKRNRDLHRRVTIAMTRAFLLCGTFTLERWAGIRIITHGAAIPPDVATFCILNHCSDIDMLIGLAWLSRYGHPYPGNAKAVVKASLGAVPVFGWILKFGEFPRISRVWARDRIRLSNDIKSLLTFKTPLWYVLYPEGSRFTPEKHVVSQEYARTNGYPVLNNLLLPRTKAFIALVEELRGNVDSICDATLMFDGPIPSAKTVLSGECSTVIHAHVEHLKMSDLPHSESELTSWIMSRWEKKDSLIESFKKDPSVLGPPCVTYFPRGIDRPSVWPFLALFATYVLTAGSVLWSFRRNMFMLKLLLLGPPVALVIAGLKVLLALRPSEKGTGRTRNKVTAPDTQPVQQAASRVKTE